MTPAVASHRVEGDLTYDGSQLRSHFAYRAYGVEGDCIVAFVGPCEVPTDAMVDLEDRRRGAFLSSRRMLHFLAEHFDREIERTVLRQRILVVIAAEAIESLGAPRPQRTGDDLFVDRRKLSVSIATACPVSTLIHLGLNVDAAGAPVPAADLAEIGVDPVRLADEILRRYAAEMESAGRARRKVCAVP